jgi:hypothetical protein
MVVIGGARKLRRTIQEGSSIDRNENATRKIIREAVKANPDPGRAPALSLTLPAMCRGVHPPAAPERMEGNGSISPPARPARERFRASIPAGDQAAPRAIPSPPKWKTGRRQRRMLPEPIVAPALLVRLRTGPPCGKGTRTNPGPSNLTPTPARGARTESCPVRQR